MAEAPSWDLPNPNSADKNRVSLITGDSLSTLKLQQGDAYLYAYDAADVMDDENYTTVLESFVSASSLQVADVNTKKVSGLDL